MRTELERELEALAQTLRASTVGVRSGRGAGSGSGVVWSAGGAIITNAHVAMTPTVEIETADGRRLQGTVERRDESRDLAAIRVAAADLPAVETRDPDDLRVGEMLVAFGHPLGVRNVLTTGIAFGRHRSGEHRFVRADLRLAPGNSGGALADIAGRVIGINSMIAGGLALAIPTGDVHRFLSEAGQSARLGVRLSRVRLDGRNGRAAYAVIATEPGSTAERSGLIPGDLIVTANLDALARAPQVNILRGGIALTVTLDRRAGGIAAAA